MGKERTLKCNAVRALQAPWSFCLAHNLSILSLNYLASLSLGEHKFLSLPSWAKQQNAQSNVFTIVAPNLFPQHNVPSFVRNIIIVKKGNSYSMLRTIHFCPFQRANSPEGYGKRDTWCHPDLNGTHALTYHGVVLRQSELLKTGESCCLHQL